MDGKVYDLTEFADEHPGGEELIHSAPAAHPPSLLLGSAWGGVLAPAEVWARAPAAHIPSLLLGSVWGACAGAC